VAEAGDDGTVLESLVDEYGAEDDDESDVSTD
jgi:hypothetical protein